MLLMTMGIDTQQANAQESNMGFHILGGELCNEGEAIYFLMNQEKAKEMGFIHCEVEE